MTPAPPAQAAEDQIAWSTFVKFLRQLCHDLRNHLNAAELQAALVGELNRDAELKVEVQHLRTLVSQLGNTLQNLSGAVANPRPTFIPYGSADFMSDLQKKIARDFPDQTLKWDVSSESAELNIDPQLLEWTVLELLGNALRHNSGEIRISTSIEEGRFVLTLRESKSKPVDPKEWREPLSTVSHAHYGLGLRRARAIVAALSGEFKTDFNPGTSVLTSRIVLPCSTGRG